MIHLCDHPNEVLPRLSRSTRELEATNFTIQYEKEDYKMRLVQLKMRLEDLKLRKERHKVRIEG